MRAVRDDSGTTYLLLKRSGESSLVRDPGSGEERYLPNDRLEFVESSPLEAAAEGAVPSPVRRLLAAVPDDGALGLLVEIRSREPVSVRALLADYDLCESDLHGVLAEFRAAGLIEEVSVGGERGYATTPDGRDALDTIT